MKIVVRTILVCFLLSICSHLYSDEQREVTQILRDRVDTYKKSVGMVVGIVDPSGTRIYSYGKLCRDCQQAVDGDTLYEIGSITKVFTNLILEQMVEEGKVKLDDPIAKYLPKSVTVPSRNGKQITFLDLATQSSGLPRLPNNLNPADMNNPYADYKVEDMYDFLSHYTLTRDIGSQYEYSNFGMGLMGHVLTLIARQDYETLVVQRVCNPLGLASTRVTLSPELKARLASGYNAFLQPVGNWDLPTLAGAGALRSTANDLMKFVGANLGLIQSDLTPAMQKTQQPLRMAVSPDVEIGMAWHILKKYGSEIVMHDGGTGGYHSLVAFDKARKMGVVVLSNSEVDVNDIGFHLLNPQFELTKFAQEKRRIETQVNPSVLEPYAGMYRTGEGIVYHIIMENGVLFIQQEGKSRIRLFAESETSFFAKLFDLQVSFEKDSSGKITGLTLHQNGIVRQALKIESE
jgi:serine-type D-Ala-D-Ala carboxypeptidase/endopeptidase